MKYDKWIAVAAVSLILFFLPTRNAAEERAYVKRVIDGDTIELNDSSEKLRLIGIGAPERGERCYGEAKNKLAEAIEGKELRLETDITNRDRYGRLLRYIYVNDTFVNEYMVSEGFAHSYYYEPDTKHYDTLLKAEAYAKENRKGCLWGD